MQNPAGDDQNPDPERASEPIPGPRDDDDDKDLAAMEADLDAVDAVLEAIDRGDLDTAESIAASLGVVDDDSTDSDPDPAEVTAPRDPD